MSRSTDPNDARALLDSLFERHADEVYRFALARSGSHSVAEEVTSDAFTEAARAVAGGEREISVGWLITTARRRLIDRWRANERHRDKLRRLRSEREAVEVRRVLEDASMLRVLQSLPERQRAALTLRYLDDYSVSEVAEALECSYRSAESLLARARRSFAAAYGEGS